MSWVRNIALTFDEGWRLLGDPVGRTLLASLQRMGRSELAVPIVSTQLVTDALVGERESLENLLGATFVFGMRSEERPRARSRCSGSTPRTAVRASGCWRWRPDAACCATTAGASRRSRSRSSRRPCCARSPRPHRRKLGECQACRGNRAEHGARPVVRLPVWEGSVDAALTSHTTGRQLSRRAHSPRPPLSPRLPRVDHR